MLAPAPGGSQSQRAFGSASKSSQNHTPGAHPGAATFALAAAGGNCGAVAWFPAQAASKPLAASRTAKRWRIIENMVCLSRSECVPARAQRYACKPNGQTNSGEAIGQSVPYIKRLGPKTS
ncbi:hypothetical protein GCM10028811_23480 [Uliginosibacterium sediminicola]